MARKKDDSVWVVIGIGLLALAGIVLYHEKTGQGKENNSALIPDDIERHIDELVAALNYRFTHQWVTAGMYALRMYVRSVMPQLVTLVDVVAEVEQRSKLTFMSGPEKKRVAVQMARGLRA